MINIKTQIRRLGTILLLMVITGCGSSSGTDSISTHSQSNAGAFPDCLACHSSKQPSLDPTATNSTGAAGKHVTHAATRGIACVRCHLNYTDQATHMNGTLDTPDTAVRLVYFDSANPNGRWINDTGLQKGKCSSLVCHGTDTPDWYGTGWTLPDCSTCHVGSLDPQYSNGASPVGTHIAHVTDGGFACVKCHNNYTSKTTHMNGALDTPYPAIKLVYFDSTNPSGQWINDSGPQTGSCSNVYCHSIVQTTTGGALILNTSDYKTPDWGGDPATCSSCHGNTPAGGSHLKHAGSGSGQYAFTCEQCHSRHVPPSATTSHADGEINTEFPATWGGGAYNGNTTPGSGFSNCSNTYCHSNGTSVATGVIPNNESPTWGSAAVPLACTSCHGVGTTDGRPSYPQMTPEGVLNPKANAHEYHSLTVTKFPAPGCQGCHYTTTTTGNTITNPSNHVNRQYDVVVMPGTVNFAYTPDPGGIGGYCTNVTCHGSFPNESFWGKYQAYIPAITITNGQACYEASFSVTSMLNTTFPLQYYDWDFGDGQTSHVTNASLPIVSGTHAYMSGTSRTVTISGRDSSQRYFKKSQTVTPQPVANQRPTAGLSLPTINRYAVTVTDLSSDLDYNTCGTGPGWITINWGNSSYPTITQESIYLTESPSNNKYSFTYGASNVDKIYTITHSIVDNNNATSSNGPLTRFVTLPGDGGQTDISGKVLQADGVTGFPGVTVNLRHSDINRTLITAATTDANGSFSFSGKYYDQFLIVEPVLAGHVFLRTISCSPWLYLPTNVSCVYTNTTDVNFTAAP